LIDPSLDERHFAEFARSHILHRALEVFAAAALGSHLHDAVVFPRSGAHGMALVNGLRKRFFAVHVFAGGAGIDHLNGVPVVRRGDDDSIDVFVFEDAAVVLLEAGHAVLFGVQVRTGFFEDGLIQVAEGLELGSCLNGTEGIAPALVSAADEGEGNAIVCAEDMGHGSQAAYEDSAVHRFKRYHECSHDGRTLPDF